MSSEKATCRFCGKELKIKSKRFRKQTVSGHEAMCPKNPDRMKRDAQKKMEHIRGASPSQDHQGSLTSSSLQSGTLSPGAMGGSPNVSAAQSFISKTSSTQAGEPPPVLPSNTPGYLVVQQPGMEPQMIPEVQSIPPEVISEWLMATMSANLDIAIHFAQKRNLKDPEPLKMSSATSKWLGQMISHKIGPQDVSWAMIIGTAAPFILYPWAQIMATSEGNPIKKIISWFKRDKEPEKKEDDENGNSQS